MTPANSRRGVGDGTGGVGCGVASCGCGCGSGASPLSTVIHARRPMTIQTGGPPKMTMASVVPAATTGAAGARGTGCGNVIGPGGGDQQSGGPSTGGGTPTAAAPGAHPPPLADPAPGCV